MAYVYKILNKINGKFYIGSTNNYKRRWYSHKYELNNNKHNNNYLQNAWNKYGENNFEFSIIEECSKNKQFEREQYYIDLLHACNNEIGYNLCTNASGGGNNKGEDFVMSKYTNKQIIKVKNLIINDYDNVNISKITGVKNSTVSAIKGLRIWNDVGKEYNYLIYNMHINQKNKITQKDLTNDLLKKAYELKKSGVSMKKIHRILNCQSRILTHPLYIYASKIKGKQVKKCIICGKDMVVKNNKQKYCKKCVKKSSNKEKLIHKKEEKKKMESKKLIKENKLTYSQIKNIKHSFIEDNKEKIIYLYIDKNYSLSKIANNIKTKEVCLTNKNIEEKLKEWEIYDYTKKQNNERYNEKNIIYNGVYTLDNNLIKVFRFKWECREWMIENKIASTDSQAKNYMSLSNNHNKVYEGYIFKNITKDEYEKYNV